MSTLNWGFISDGGVLESLMHAVLYAADRQTILFGRPGKDAGQDARTADGTIVYQSKYRDSLDMDEAVKLALEELEKIKKYRAAGHANYDHWKDAKRWVLFANLSINPNDDAKWKRKVIPEFGKEGLAAEYWGKEVIEGKLAEALEIRDVFFGQENRVLVGLKEAREILKNERIENRLLDAPLIGRGAELTRVQTFINSPDKRVLPVIGPGGVGKSRFLYESLITLSKEGWRVLWGLPGAMARSSQWFRLLNGTQKTCVALDDPDDPGLLRTVIEQLSATERRNWRVIVSCRSDHSESLRRYKAHRNVDEAIRLNALNEPDSKILLNHCLGYEADPAWLHRTYRFTQGNPGWLCLIAELARQGKLEQLPPKTDDIASLYVTATLEKLDTSTAGPARTLLRWIALWGAFVFETGGEGRDEIEFLEKEGIPKAALPTILKNLTSTGLVRNFGIGKRLYAVEPLLIRQHILSEWLLQEDGDDGYSVNPSGSELIKRLLDEAIPHSDSALQTLSQLAISRLEEPEVHTFLRPVFKELAAIAAQASLITQNHLAELVAKLGVADPETALDLLAAIRENANEDQVTEDPFWGKITFTRDKLLTALSWTLFNLAEYVDRPHVAHRFLVEFRELARLAGTDPTPSDSGKHPRQLLGRLLCESRNSSVFAQPAYEMATANLLSPDWWPFVGDLAKCLLDPKRETMEWIAHWTLGVSSFTISPESSDWTRLVNLRTMLFGVLRSDEHKDLQERVWAIVADSHKSLHYATLHHRMSDENRQKYRALLIHDLTECEAILKSCHALGEATRARSMWEWYLKYGQDEALVALARECERLYADLSKWRIHDFFRFDYDERLEVEVERVAKALRSASDPSVFVDFFDEMGRYLSAAHGRSDDMADGMQLGALADKLADLFSLDGSGSSTPLSSFVLSGLAASAEPDPRSFSFAVMVCRARLGQLKASGETDPTDWLNRLLAHTSQKGAVLYRFYSNAHPRSTGPVSIGEAQCVLAHKNDFHAREWFWLLGVLVGAVDERLSEHVVASMESFGPNRSEASNCLAQFVRSAHLAFRRYERTPTRELSKAILDWIIRFRLDGSLFGFHDLEAMNEHSGFVPDMSSFVALMRSRVELERETKPDEQFRILPYRFDVKSWCKYDPTNNQDVLAFKDLCRLALQRSFTASYWIPKYLTVIDPSGSSVATFVTGYLAGGQGVDPHSLSKLAYLASQYPPDSDAWALIARPICEKARGMSREDREHIYFSLSRKETGVMTSMPGEVPHYYVEARESAKRLMEEEPQDSSLRPYREWAFMRAEHDLRREEGRAEELADE